MVYLFNYLLIPLYFFPIFFIAKNRDKASKLFFIIVGVHVILFRALANPYVYVDTIQYEKAFTSIADMSYDEAILSVNIHSSWGQGYVALNWLISRFTNNPAYLFVVVAVLSVGGVISFYYKTSRTPLLTVMFYLLYPMMYIMGFGVLRQHLAIVFVLWAVYNMDRLRYAIPLSLIGALFHTTAIVVIPFFFLRNFSLRNFNLITFAFFSLFGFIISSFMAEYIVSFFDRYEKVYNKIGNETNIVPVVLIGLTVLVFYLTGAIRNATDNKDIYIIKFFIYGFVIALFGMTVPSAGRLTLYFIYLIPVAFSILSKYGIKSTKFINSFYAIAVFSVSILMIYMSTRTSYQVYEFFWNNKL